MVHYIEEPCEDYSGCNEKRLFDYKYDNSFIKEFGELKLNHKITTYQIHDNDYASIAGTEGYVHFNLYQKIVLGWTFQRNCLQNPENIKWLIGIPISIITAYITAKLTSGN
ncbi:MAG: hypothetical protein DRJ10_11865 [Bacteroidetes bacterium]|nr:MAG: hypothetical protein DRJ10_11865 [Bacteroidota bacterium]